MSLITSIISRAKYTPIRSNRIMSLSQSWTNNTPTNKASFSSKDIIATKHEDYTEIEAIFAVDDSFGDDNWDVPTNSAGGINKSEHDNSQELFFDMTNDDLIRLTSPKRKKMKQEILEEEQELKTTVTTMQPPPTLRRDSSSKIITGTVATASTASTGPDSSPVWHRTETWLNVNKDSSPVVSRNRKTPLLALSSSPVKKEEIHIVDLDLEPDFPSVEAQPEPLRPVRPLSASAIAQRLLFQSRRNISTSARTSARTRNSTIELMTQKPSMMFDIEESPEPFAKNVKQEKNVKPIILSEEQLKVVEILKQGESLFYTGSAGTGKSILLKSLIKTLRKQHGFNAVGVAASTGLALCNIGGSTLHSLTGIGLGNGDVKSLLKKIRRSKKSLSKWKQMNVLFIDEISMIDGDLLDKLNSLGKSIRGSKRPFGGIQLIVCGDFYQLPPVLKDREIKFAFESDAWKEAIKITIVLQKVFRQQGDMKFVDMLNDLRRGVITPETEMEFRYLNRSLPSDDEIEATELFPMRHEVDHANSGKLNKIKEPLVQFNAYDTGTIEDPLLLQKLLSNFLAPKVLHLKKGAQVMMVKNIDDTLVNGSLGKVLDFIDPDTYMFYQNRGSVDASDIESAIENKLKSDKKVTKGQLVSEYLSQEPPSDGLDESVFEFLDDIDTQGDEELEKDIKRKKELITQLHHSSKGKRLPLVRFVLTDGNTRDVLVELETFQVEDPQNEHKPLASRQQIPLILAWALSIHKSQGQTLTKVKVDLRRTFEKGQAYVALSRATSRKGLQVLNFRPDKIMTHQKVIEFYNQLISVDDVNTKDVKREAEESDSDFEKEMRYDDPEWLSE